MLGYAFFEAALISIFLLTNNLVLNSLPRAVLKKSLCVGLGAVVLLVLVSQPFDIKKFQLSPSLQSELQGYFNIEKKWNFGDLEKVETPSQWAAWLNSAAVLSPEQLLKALDKLEAICPAIPTDIPAYITCYEKDPTERAAIIKISTSSSEADILIQLKSPNMYMRLVGLFAARHLEKFSSELTAVLQKIYQTPGRLSSVAEKTLGNVKFEKPSGVNVRILAEQTEPRKN